MTRSHRQAENGLISGYKKAEQLARKKVLTEISPSESPPSGRGPGLVFGLLGWLIENNILKFQCFLLTFYLGLQVCQGWTGAS
jgi:hypothetical protein